MRIGRGMTVAVIITIVIASGSAIILLGDFFAFPEPVPPPDEPPSTVVEEITVDDLELVATAFFWQDFMPIVPAEGPPFYLVIRLNVTNTGNSTVFGLDVSRVTVYFSNLTPMHTFDIQPGLTCCFDEFSVAPGQTEFLEFTNDRETIFSPEVAEGTDLFAQVLFTWDPDGEAILTTASVPLLYTH